MNANRILCPVDFSTCSDEAIHHATHLARQHGAILCLLHVVEESASYPLANEANDYGASRHQQAEQQLKAIVPADSGVRYEHHLRTGRPAGEILDFASQHKIDLIVMGTHGRGAIARALMGSIAEEVVRKASCPVLTYKACNHVAVEP